VNEKADISGIRFATTSHDNKRAKLHLAIIIYGVSGNACDSNTKVVASFVSLPIFVNTRGCSSSRENKVIYLNWILEILTPFKPILTSLSMRP